MSNNFNNGLLICEGNGKNKNIGDYIQSIASKQFFDKIDCYVEREALNKYVSEKKTKVIMNGWFMWNPANWPPSKDIEPLFISFHLVPSIAKQFFTEESIKYFKQYEPIGCRDYNTCRLFEMNGIKAYFSGCLTLTLDYSYPKPKKTSNEIIFVDPYVEYDRNSEGNKDKLLMISNFIFGIFHIYQTMKIYKKLILLDKNKNLRLSSKIKGPFIFAANFYKIYSKSFTNEVLFNAKILTHTIPQIIATNNETKFKIADDLLNTYNNAKLVVTSRIHCALPCLSLNTPVIFISSDNLELNTNKAIRSPGRFEGLIDLFHVGKWTKKGITFNKDFFSGRKIDSNFNFANKKDYKVLRDSLILKSNSFIDIKN